MKRLVILGAGQMGSSACNLFNPNSIKVSAFGGNNPHTWNTIEAPDGGSPPVLPVLEALKTKPDLVLIGVLDAEREGQFKAQLSEAGYAGDIMSLGELHNCFDIRGAVFKSLARRILETPIEGALAELGVYKGDFAWQLNEQFPGRKLYLFDTFEGFHEQDISMERQIGGTKAQAHDFSDTSKEDVLARMPHREQVVVKKGYFPAVLGTPQPQPPEAEERFALVSIDADLYAPTLAGLAYFYPRLNPGGVIILHDYNNRRFEGVRKAVDQFEADQGMVPLVPLCDLHGTAIIIRA